MATRFGNVITGGPDTARFAWLLLALLVALALPPILLAIDLAFGSLRFGLAAVLVASLWVVSRRARVLWAGIALAAPALVLDWVSFATGSATAATIGGLAAVGFLGLVIVETVGTLMRADRVTTDTILGGVCVYLLLGILWVSLFSLLETLQPGSLLIHGAPLSEHGATPEEPFRHPEILYFSFVTLTTLGYGDITPATPAARSCAAAEAIVGQLYVTIFVARLVGLHLAHSRSDA